MVFVSLSCCDEASLVFSLTHDKWPIIVLDKSDHQFFSDRDFCFLEWVLAGNQIALSLSYRMTYTCIYLLLSIESCKHIQVYLLTCGLVQNVLCFLLFFYETSFVKALNLMICGRLQEVPCKQTILKQYCFQSFKSLRPFLKIQTFTLIMFLFSCILFHTQII